MRRGKGEGSVFKRASDGLWVAKLPPETRPDGSTFRPAFAASTKTRALEKRSAYQAAKARGQAGVGKGKETLGDYLTAWVEVHRVAESTRKAYVGHIVNHIAPARIGKLRLTAVTTAHVREFIAELGHKPEISEATVERIRATLSKGLNTAVVAGLIPFNPAHMAKAPTPPPGKRAHKPMRAEDVVLFVKVAREHRLWPLWAVLLGTGARMGDVLKLKWEDVSFKGATVHYRDGKTDSSDRFVPLPSWALEALKDHQEKTGGTRGLVFVTSARGRWEGGKPISGRNVNRYFHELLVLAGIEDRRPHDLRHTYATMQLADGTDMTTVADLLGHEPGSPITRKFYVSVGSPAKDEAARRADAWIAA